MHGKGDSLQHRGVALERHITADGIAQQARKLVEANLPGYAKIVNVTDVASNLRAGDRLGGHAPEWPGGTSALKSRRPNRASKSLRHSGMFGLPFTIAR